MYYSFERKFKILIALIGVFGYPFWGYLMINHFGIPYDPWQARIIIGALYGMLLLALLRHDLEKNVFSQSLLLINIIATLHTGYLVYANNFYPPIAMAAVVAFGIFSASSFTLFSLNVYTATSLLLAAVLWLFVEHVDYFSNLFVFLTMTIQPVSYISLRHRFQLENIIEKNKNQLQNYSLDLEQRVKERTAELEKEKVRAEKSEKLKSMFLANMSHEIRTPLNSIIGFTELIDREPDREETHLFLENIRHSGQLLMMIVNDILDLAKIESGNLNIETYNVDLDEVLTDVQRMASILVAREKKNIEICLQKQENISSHILTDKTRLLQILNNLVSNAVKFTEQGKIEIALSLEQADKLSFAVTDTGIGIDSEHIEEIFKSFVQADSGICRKFGGTGLGLTITQRLIELMGSSITVKSSTGIHHGSKFSFHLPYCPVEAERSKNLPEIKIPEKSFKILVAEDNKLNQMLTGKFLKTLGYTYAISENGKEALDALEKDPDFHLVLMDIQMPVMDGLEAVKILRNKEKEKNLKRLPVVALSAGAFDSDINEAIEAGCDEYLSKPVSMQNLSATLMKLLKF